MNPNGLIIETTGAEDLEALTRFARATFRDTYAAFNTEEDMRHYLAAHFTAERLAQAMAEEGSCFLAMRRGIEWVAYAGMRHSEPPLEISVAPCWEMERFYVAKAWHGKGLAQPLMDACRKETLARGFAGMWLGVWNKNVRAIRFYRKMGFRDEGEKTFVLGDDIQSDRVMVLKV